MTPAQGASNARSAAATMAGMTGMTGMAGMTGTTAPRTDAVCPAPVSSPALPTFSEQLPVPAKVYLRNGGTAPLVMRNGTHRFSAALPATPTLGYALQGDTSTDIYGGPTIEARKGTPVALSVLNGLSDHPL